MFWTCFFLFLVYAFAPPQYKEKHRSINERVLACVYFYTRGEKKEKPTETNSFPSSNSIK
jgi:hypothetical protein